MNESVLTTIASFSFPYEAHIAKSLLESEDIPAFIADEHTINMQWLYSNAMGGVRLQVPTSLASRAKELLSQDFSHFVDSEFEEESKICSKCSGMSLEPYTQGKKPAFLVFLLLGFPLFFYKRGLKCNDCGTFNKI
jgi:hypothetical protein